MPWRKGARIIDDENTLVIYTDGSMLSHPRRGGVGIRFILITDEGEEDYLDLAPPGYRGEPSGRMEIRACVLALQEVERNPDLAKYKSILIRTDSTYVANNFQRAIFKWPGDGWQGEGGRPILHADAWRQLVALKGRIRKRIELQWLPNADKNKHHKVAHRLSRMSAQSCGARIGPGTRVRRRWSTQSTIPGSVKMAGQRISIRIIESLWLNRQRTTRYRFEVISKSSPDRGKVDFAFARPSLDLRAAHSYYVVLNRNPQSPEILHVIRELRSVRRTRAIRTDAKKELGA